MTRQQKYKKKNIEKIRLQAKEYRERPEVKNKINSKQQSLEHKEYMKNYIKDYNKDSVKVDKHRDKKFKRTYNISLEEYNNMFEEQEGKCFTCGINQSKLEKRLSIDHNHTTGKVRSLLCQKCNLAIGLLNEDKELVKNILEYLKYHG